MGLRGKHSNQQAHGHNKKRKAAIRSEEIRKEGKSPTSWLGRNLCQANVQVHEEIRRNNASPEARALHFVEDKHEQKRHIAERDMIGTVETTWERKKTHAENSGTSTQGPEHYAFVSSQYKRGGLAVKEFKSVVWW